MAIYSFLINNQISGLRECLEFSRLFGSVEDGADTNSIDCFDGDGNKLASFTLTNSSIVVRAYVNAQTYKQVSVSLSTYPSTVKYGYVCANGVLFGGTGSYPYPVAIAKTNNGKVAVIFSKNPYSGAGAYESYYSVTWGDAAEIIEFSYKSDARNQTVIVPFATGCMPGEVSYTPYAGYLPSGQYYNMGYGKFKLDGAMYITNGYWTIRDKNAE